MAAAGFSAGFPGPVGCLKEPAEKPAAGKIACPTHPVQLFAAKPRCATWQLEKVLRYVTLLRLFDPLPVRSPRELIRTLGLTALL